MTLFSQFVASVTGSGLNPHLKQARINIFILVTVVLSVLLIFSGYNIYYETRKNLQEERDKRRSLVIEEIRLKPVHQNNPTQIPPNINDQEESLERLRFAIFINNIVILSLLLSCSWISLYVLLLPVSRAQEERNRFLAEASHELRTPLAILYSEMSLASSETDAEKLKVVHKESLLEIKRLQQLSNTLLAQLDHRNGDTSDSGEQINLYSVVSDIISSLKSVNPNKIAFETNIDKNFTLKASKNELYRLIFNLLDNANKYSVADTKALINLKESELSIKNVTEIEQIKVGIGLEICEKLALQLGFKLSYSVHNGQFESLLKLG